MKAVKFLERTIVIRFFGIALLLAPFVNITMNLILQSKKNAITASIVWHSLMSGTFAQNAQNVLGIASVTIGIIMLRGSPLAWRYVLGFLGLQIVIQTTTLMKDVKESWVWMAVFVINLAVFFFIADQLVFKDRSQDPKEQEPDQDPSTSVADLKSVAAFPAPQASSMARAVVSELGTPVNQPISLDSRRAVQERAPVYTTKKKIVIQFSEMKMWAQLIHISRDGLLVKSYSQEPHQFANHRTIQVFLTSNLGLRLRLKSARGPEYFFEFVDLTQAETHSLNDWILSKAS